jgi:hypothetical protein
VENEGSAHSQDAAEKARLEHDVISRRCLTRSGLRGGRRTARRPVVLCKDKCREIDLAGQFKETLQCGRSRIEGCRPGFDLRDVGETACQSLKQLFLFSRRAQEYSRLVHQFLQPTNFQKQKIWFG